VADVTREARYLEHAARLQGSGFVFDPWFDGAPRFLAEPMVLGAGRWHELGDAAEQVAASYEAIAQLCLQEPALLDEIGLTPFQKLMWASSAPLWHGIARADAFLTDTGIAICEINSDTPTGEPEAVVSSALAWQAERGVVDPNEGLRDRFLWMIESLRQSLAPLPDLRSVGIVYPTELTEDLGMISLYHHWLREAGYQVTLGSPFNLQSGGPTGVRLLDVPCDVVVRHYKTDWWGERASVWREEDEYPDKEPLEAQLGILVRAAAEGTVAVINPFGSVLTQNKRAMAAMWEHLDQLPVFGRTGVERHVPLTIRLEKTDRALLLREREAWVLKSDYGCEGDQVVMGCDCTDAEWEDSLRKAVPERWVAQRRFVAQAGPSGEIVNYGVYLIGGSACGLLCRAQPGATDPAAVVVPALVEEA
jgi:glutathionylspermidine synthase